MKTLTRLVATGISASFLALGCGPDSGVIAPATPSDGIDASLKATRFSEWSGPVNLGTVVNSPFTEQQPALSKKGRALYFASNRPTDPSDKVLDQNIWVARRACTDEDTRCAWTMPVVLGPAVNGQFLEAAPSLSRDEHQLFFTSQRPNAHCPTAPCDRDLWVSYRDNVHDDFGWQAAVSLPGAVNTTGEEIAPSYFENGEAGGPQLFFNNGVVQGGQLTLGDIYVSNMAADGTWGARARIDELNTEFADQRPSIATDGLTIYFWSNRDGIAHLWFSARQHVGDQWLAPELVPSPISDALTIQPYIHSHGKRETLLFVRTEAGYGNDLFMSQRTRHPGHSAGTDRD